MPAPIDDPAGIARQWFQDFGDDLFAFAVRRLGRNSFSEDLVQDTFLTVIESLRLYDAGTEQEDFANNPTNFNGTLNPITVRVTAVPEPTGVLAMGLIAVGGVVGRRRNWWARRRLNQHFE